MVRFGAVNFDSPSALRCDKRPGSALYNTCQYWNLPETQRDRYPPERQAVCVVVSAVQRIDYPGP